MNEYNIIKKLVFTEGVLLPKNSVKHLTLNVIKLNLI